MSVTLQHRSNRQGNSSQRKWSKVKINTDYRSCMKKIKKTDDFAIVRGQSNLNIPQRV